MQILHSYKKIIEIIICTYNGAKFLNDQLNSILKQTYRPDVISIYDDNSIDDSLLIIESLRRLFESSGIEYRVTKNLKNLGYSKNFFQAVEKCKCEFIYFCDQDDIWDTEKVAIIYQQFQNSRVDLIFSDGLIVDAKGIPSTMCSVLESYELSVDKIESFNKRPMRYLARRNYVNGCAAAVRSSAALQAGPPPHEMPHDYWFALWCATHGGVRCLSDKLYKYRQHDNNVIGIGGDNFIYQILSIFQSPRGPRQRELRILKCALDRLDSVTNTDVSILRDKLKWINSIVNEPNRLIRFGSILLTLIQGKYTTFGQPYSLLRDLVSCIKS